MTLLAPTLEAFFTQRLIDQRPNTIASYRDTFRLLLAFAHDRTGRPPSRLALEDLDAPLIAATGQSAAASRILASGSAVGSATTD